MNLITVKAKLSLGSTSNNYRMIKKYTEEQIKGTKTATNDFTLVMKKDDKNIYLLVVKVYIVLSFSKLILQFLVQPYCPCKICSVACRDFSYVLS